MRRGPARRPIFAAHALVSIALLVAARPASAQVDLALVREAVAVDAAAADRRQPEFADTAAGLLLEAGDCEAAKRLAGPKWSPMYFYADHPAARPCLVNIARVWLSAPGEDRPTVARRHAAGAVLRLAGREREGSDAITLAAVLLANRDVDHPRWEQLQRMTDRLRQAIGAVSDEPLWEARLTELLIYSGSPLVVPTLERYIVAAERTPRGLNEADQLARTAFKAGRPDLGRRFLATLPSRTMRGSRGLVTAELLSEFGDDPAALAALAQVSAEERGNAILKASTYRRMLDSDWIRRHGEPGTRTAQYVDAVRWLELAGDAERIARALAIALDSARTEPLDAEQRRMLVYEAAAGGRAEDADALAAGAPAAERDALRAEIALAAAHVGDWKRWDRAIADGVRPDMNRLGYLKVRRAPGPVREEAVRRVITMLAALPATEWDRVATFVGGLESASEYRVAAGLIGAEPDVDARFSRWVSLAHAMLTAGRPGLAADAARRARADLRPDPARQAAAAWLLHRLGDRTAALRTARAIADPGAKAAALLQLARPAPAIK